MLLGWLVVSLKKYLTGEHYSMSGALLRVASRLLEALALHAVDYDPVELETFQSGIRSVRTNLEASNDPAAVLLMGGEAIRELENYNRRVERTLLARRREVQSILAMMTQSLLELSKGNVTSSDNLRSIEEKLDGAAKVEDIRVLKAQLAVCLQNIRTEAERQQACSVQAREKMERTLAKQTSASASGLSRSDIDVATGLGNWNWAEESMEQALAEGRLVFAAGLRLDRFDLINKRYSQAAGDQALMLVSQHVAQNLHTGDQLFRWRGPALIALLDRGSLQAARSDVTNMLSTRLTCEVTTEQRAVRLPLSVSWVIFAADAGKDLRTISAQLDTFAASQATGASLG